MMHQTSRRSPFLLILLTFIGLLALVFVCVNTWIEHKIEDQLAAISAKAASVQVNLLSRSVTLKELEIYPADSSPYSVRIKRLAIQGIDLYTLWNENKIVVHKFLADSGKVSYNKLLKDKARSPNPSKKKFNDLAIQNFSITNLIFEISKDTIKVFSCVVNLSASGIAARLDSLKKFSTETFDGILNDIKINQGINMYHLSIASVRFNNQQRNILIDSALLIPNYGKFDFARIKGEQVGRVSVAIPKLSIEGFDFTKVRDSIFSASKIEITSFELYSFKDKRVPFLRDYTIPLPMESLLKVPYEISIDSLVIKDSRVTIEEFPEKGVESGVLIIDQINATCGRITNQYKEGDSKYALLKASGSLMNSGEIKATFSLPLDGSLVYYANGSIAKLPFEKLNPVLENIARFRIESGKLNNLKFDFQYTDLKSIGTMEIDYEDLKITGLNKKNDATNDIKTLLINAFVKDTKSKSLSKLKRTGPINIERDRKRYIFNVWWKSILDGLKSTILGIESNKKSGNGKSRKSKS